MKKYTITIITDTQKITTQTNDELLTPNFGEMFTIKGDAQTIYVNMDKVQTITFLENKEHE
jgi:hypothetical protein